MIVENLHAIEGNIPAKESVTIHEIYHCDCIVLFTLYPILPISY
jgi:hypothetical protein